MPKSNDNETNDTIDHDSFSVSTQCQPATLLGSSPVPKATPKQVTPFVIRFVVMWLAFVVVLCGLALLTNINWALPFMQEALGETLHRDVTLGKMSWSFGFDGLEIDTRKLIVKEHDGRPFLNAGNSGIGIAFTPLLHGKLLLRHVTFEHPELWITRQDKGRWNFTDLLVYGPDIRYIRCDGGKVHIADAIADKKPQWRQLDLENFKVSYLWPRKHRKTPFYLAFKYPRKEYTTAMQIDGMRGGKNERWQEDEYKFELKAEKLTADDFRPIINAVGPAAALHNAAATTKTSSLGGLFDGTISGEGIFSRAINTTVTGSAKNFSFDAGSLGKLQSPAANLTAQLSINDKKLEWHDLKLKLADISLKSDGELDNWLSEKVSYEAKVGSKIADLSEMQNMLSFEKQVVASAQQAKQHWSGKAEVEVHVLGDSTGSKIDTKINAEEVLAKTLVESLPAESRSLAQMLGFSEDAKVKGKVVILPGEKIEIQDAELPIAVGTVHAVGTVDLTKKLTTVAFKGTDLAIKKVQEKLNEKLHSGGKRAADLPKGVDVRLDGLVDLTGQAILTKDKTDSSGTINLRKALFSLSDKSLDMRNITGDVNWKNDRFQLSKVSGEIGNGTFVLEGNSALAAKSDINLRMTAKNADLNQLESLLRTMQLEFPILTEHQLTGRVKELVLAVTGNPKKPNVYMSAVPDDVYYAPPGLTRPLHVRGGTMVYDHDNLSLKELLVQIKSDRVIASIEITDLSHSATLQSIKLNTAGLELADANYYLSSTIMPTPLKTAYKGLLDKFSLTQMHGRVNGDLTYRPTPKYIHLDGTVSMMGVGVKMGAHGFPISHVLGTVTASGNRLVVQNMIGSLHNSKFNIDGHIDSYLYDNPTWSLQVAASVEPRELLELVPAMNNDRVQAWHPTISASSALDFTATVNGGNGKNDIDFKLDADPKDELAVKTAFGSLYQPKGEAIAFDGFLHSDQKGVELTRTHLAIGKSTLEVSGGITYSRTAPENPSSPQPIDLADSDLDFHVSTAETMPAFKFLSLLNPLISKNDVQGSMDGSLTLSGPFTHAKPAGRLKVENVTWKQCDLYNLSGTISMDAAKNGEKQVGKLDVTSMEYKKLPIKQFTADLTFNSAGTNQAALSATNGKASLAAGTATGSGTFDFNSHVIDIKCELDKLKASTLAEGLFNQSGEISGIANCNIDLSTEGDDYKAMLSNLKGTGVITATNGSVSRFGQLQAKLTQANLLHQGLFGFNLNNLLQSVYPVRTGLYKDLAVNFQMNKGVITITRLKYDGDDMRLWGAGKANLPLNTLSIEIAGQIPRVAASVIGGPVGEVSRAFTLQRVLDTLTLHRLEKLPNLPVLGDIAADKPRTFGFKMMAPLGNPKVLAQSIEKSFHWLPPKPGATAHPVPGLE
ncbi:MAG TPA: AsmA-like C-terminal region-containing protein [Planktothrix sp.]